MNERITGMLRSGEHINDIRPSTSVHGVMVYFIYTRMGYSHSYRVYPDGTITSNINGPGCWANVAERDLFS